MFEMDELMSVDPKYFNIILLDPYDISIQSRSTGHYWSLHITGATGRNACLVYHKHRFGQPFHQHAFETSLRRALCNIKSHDRWQMKGRPRNK